MIGQTISHYKILEKLGEGGMGVVYKAEDTQLNRSVALKFLPRGLEAHEAERARFLQEAQAAAALNHPNICTIYDIGQETDPKGAGQQFIVMEYVDGQTLRQRLETPARPAEAGQSGRRNLKLETLISYAIQIGEALQEAHSKGVVHRDIKTDNIMVNTRNQVKVMDFGLAKLKGSLKLTKTSSTVGTLAYMAPEQIEGGEVDARSDIFSFGVVLYEMLTGHLPFRGEHEAAMVYSIVNEEPQPIQKYLPEGPSDLAHILNRLLEKEPDERYQSIGDVVIELRRLKRQTSRVSRVVPLVQPSEGQFEIPAKPSEGFRPLRRLPKTIRWFVAGVAILLVCIIAWLILRPGEQPIPVASKEKSIAVMYFENKTDKKDLDKILVNMLTTNLGRNKEIFVVSDQRLFDILKSLGKQDVAAIDKSTATEVAKRAGVKTMLLGTIWEVGGKLSFPAQLLDVESGSVLNSDRVEAAKAEEIFTVADRLTEKINEWLKASPDKPLRISDAATSSYDAYKFYEKGMQHIYRFEYPEAIEDFGEAVKLDSTFALAHLRLAMCQGGFSVFNPIPGRGLDFARESIAKAKRYAKNLSDRDRKFLEVQEAMLRRDFAGGSALMRDLVVEFLEDKEIVSWSAASSWFYAKFEDAVRSFERAIELDRSYSDAYNNLGYAYAITGEYEKAISTIKTYIALIPDAWNGYDSGCELYMMAGRYEEALKYADEGLKRVPSHYAFFGRRAQVYFLMGEPDKARGSIKPWAQLGAAWPEAMHRYTSISFLIEGRIKEAIDVAQQGVRRLKEENDQGNELFAHFYLARIFLEQARFEEAFKELEAVKYLSEQTRKGGFNPWPLMCDYYSGLCYIRKGDPGEAKRNANEIRAAAETKVHDRYYLNHYSGLRGEMQLSQGKSREASASMEQIVPFIRYFFPRFRILDARIAVQLGDRSKALKLYDQTYNLVWIQGSELGGDFLDFWLERSKLDYYKAKTYEQFGDKSEAMKFYQKAIQNWRNADKDYPPYIEAQQRLALLVKGG